MAGVAVSSYSNLNFIRIVQGSIIEQDTDAIVTIIPQNLEYRGSINNKIQTATGEKLCAFIKDNVMTVEAGDVHAVPGFNLPCEHILFCVVPTWRDEWDRHEKQLLNAVRKAMELARRMGLKSIAIPPIGSGSKGFPKPRAVRLIVQGICERLDSEFEDIRIVCQRLETVQLFEERVAQQKFN